MQNILLFDLTKKQCIKEVSALFLVHLCCASERAVRLIHGKLGQIDMKF